ncbi:fructose-6-phosphate aldolase [Candidatus Marinamargulisbacteria bacterium SCGC AG-343-D04]|nr:fructose-6-phosphate aldolase [Candidatus Marinamargulisbacteria bacterium SCGC AG-343-D04]
MQFFIDTADVSAIKQANEMGLVDGVTTNPSLIKKAGQDHEETIREIASFIDGPISVETLSEDAEGMLKEADEYINWGKNIVIKVVMTPEGMKVVKELSSRGIQTNVTVTFSAAQALIAAKAGATYVSPFVGRLDDIGHYGMELIEQMRAIFDNYGFSTKILVASVRNPIHLLDSALIGADVATVPPATLMQLFNHPLTDKGIAAFLNDAKQWKKGAKVG